MALDIECEFTNETEDTYIHQPDWINSEATTFVATLAQDAKKDIVVAAHKDLLDKLIGTDGTIYGRAAIST